MVQERCGYIYGNLLNNCMKEACFPNNWKIAELIFILKDKNKDKSKLGSYRPIALLPTIGKVPGAQV